MQQRVQTLFQRFLHILFRMTRGLTLGVRAVIRNESGEFLLIRHTYTSGWHFPGGGVEKGENALQALGKEVAQETGFQLVGTPVLHGVFHNKIVSQNDHVLVYLCEVVAKSNGFRPNIEISEISYFNIEALPANTDKGTLRRINEIVNGSPLDENW